MGLFHLIYYTMYIVLNTYTPIIVQFIIFNSYLMFLCRMLLNYPHYFCIYRYFRFSSRFLRTANNATINILHLPVHFGFYFHRKISQNWHFWIKRNTYNFNSHSESPLQPIVSLSPFVLTSPVPPPFSRGACIFRQQSPAVRTHPCQVWIISAQWEQGLNILVALCLYCFWLARLFTIPLAHLFHAVELYMLFICSRSSVIIVGAGRGRESGTAGWLLQCFLTKPYRLCFPLCPFFDSWIEKSSSIPSQCSACILRDLGFGTFMSIF